MHCIKQCKSDISSTRLSLLSVGEEKAAELSSAQHAGCRMPIADSTSNPPPLLHFCLVSQLLFNTPTIA